MAGKLLARGDVSPRIDTVLRDVTRIGAASDNEVCVSGAGVASYHARLTDDAGAFAVEAVGQAPLSVNGARVTRAELQHLDVITLAPRIDLVFVSTNDVPTSADLALDRVTIEWLDGPDQGRTIEIPRGESMIGRAPFCAILVDAPAISRAQARLSHTGERVKLEDLGSPNGTFVGGRRIDRPVLLASGDTVTLGGVRRFKIVMTTTSAAPSRPATAPPTPVPAPAPVVDQEWRTRLDMSFGDLERVPQAVIGSAGTADARPDATMFDKNRSPLVAPPIAQESSGATQMFSGPPLGPPPELLDADRTVGPGRPVAAAKPAITSVRLESAAGVSFRIGMGTSTIGRAQNADVLLNKPHISRIHAMLEVTRDDVTLKDGGSENGTEVNGERVSSTRVLGSGDRIGFAGEMFQIEIIRSKDAGGTD